jgi:multiple sugar transport system permease protein
MFPPVTTVIPIFVIFYYLKLLDTRIGLIIIFTAFHIPLAMWILRSFFQGIPKEVQESAVLDGCSPLDVLMRIIVPLSIPGLLASGVLTFILTWNEFLFALVLTSFEAKTIPVAIATFVESEGRIQWGSMAALGTIAISPMVVFMVFMHKYLIKGLTAGALR